MLTEDDREEISRGIAENLEDKMIAARIRRCPSVVSREGAVALAEGWAWSTVAYVLFRWRARVR
jgi:hypothetical protein